MQFTPLILALFASASAVFAQDLSVLPACAATCFTNNFVNTACNPADIACLCRDSVFFSDVEICVLTTCSDADVNTTLTVATAQCAAVGVNLKRSLFGRKY